MSYFFLLTKITRSRDQILSYETETTTVRDQDQDRCKTAETKTEITKNRSRDRSRDLTALLRTLSCLTPIVTLNDCLCPSISVNFGCIFGTSLNDKTASSNGKRNNNVHNSRLKFSPFFAKSLATNFCI